MGFGKRLASVRKDKKISQSELAAKVGLHINALGRYERDETIPSIEVAAKLAKALNISLDYLCELIEIELDDVILNRIQKITSLSDADQQHIFKVVDALIKDVKG